MNLASAFTLRNVAAAAIILVLLFILAMGALAYWPPEPEPAPPGPPPPDDGIGNEVFRECRVVFTGLMDDKQRKIKNGWLMALKIQGDKPPGWAEGIECSLLTKYRKEVVGAPGSCTGLAKRIRFKSDVCAVTESGPYDYVCDTKDNPEDQIALAAQQPLPKYKANCSYVPLEGPSAQLTYGDEFYVELVLYDIFGYVRPDSAKLFKAKVPKKE